MPDAELLACRLWEYARESATISGLMDRIAALDINGVKVISKDYDHLYLVICIGDLVRRRQVAIGWA